MIASVGFNLSYLILKAIKTMNSKTEFWQYYIGFDTEFSLQLTSKWIVMSN